MSQLRSEWRRPVRSIVAAWPNRGQSMSSHRGGLPCRVVSAAFDRCPCAAQQLGEVPIIAEDLGVITPDVVELRKAIGAPGMVVLQFAWGSGSSNVHLPHNHYENCVCYPGARLL